MARSGRWRNALRFCIASLLLLAILYLAASSHSVHPQDQTITNLVKPSNIIISALIFYGRRDRVSSLRCYIERNMRDRGGWLDEVLWVVNTEDEEDIQYLDQIIASNPGRYRTLTVPGGRLWTTTYYKAWQRLDRDKYYVKIDDDIVWIDDNAIPTLVTEKLKHPDTFVVSANVINNPPLGFLHYQIGALHPYLPELSPPTSVIDSWKPLDHPFWVGPKNFTWSLQENAPYLHHRWLRVRDEKMITQTPVAQLRYEVWGDSYSSWAIAAQMHYSLLENIETGNLARYMFNKRWYMNGERIRINFICVYANDILDTNIETWPKNVGDEDMIVINLPRTLQRPVTVVGEALGAHFQYVDQSELSNTDLLTRYQGLAWDQAC